MTRTDSSSLRTCLQLDAPSQPSKCWDYRYMPPHAPGILCSCGFGMELMTFCMPEKCSTEITLKSLPLAAVVIIYNYF